jgi:type I pantothenate kinase
MAQASYEIFCRSAWARLRDSTPLTLTENDLAALAGVNERVSISEVVEIYLPLSRLLNLHVRAARDLGAVTHAFLGRPDGKPPYIVAIAGSVAVGKSTFARVLQALLARWPEHPRVELVTTDGFLYPNAELRRRDLMQRKGFPESYDLARMVGFLADVKAGQAELRAPVYSHLAYDIVADEWQTVRRPDILIFEGLNVLQTGGARGAVRPPTVIVSDFFDMSLYIDAEEEHIETWYIERFLLLQRTAFQRPHSFFHHYRDLPPTEAKEVARGIWRDINEVNLRENILPTRERAHIVLHKTADHSVEQVRLRQN